MTIQYVNLRLEILKSDVLPENSRDLVRLLDKWGLTKEPQECGWVIAYDANLNIRNVTEVTRGGHADMDIHIQPVLTAVLALGAIKWIFVHNHPTMTVTPSISDGITTHKLMAASNACGLVMEDHLIIAPTGDYYSFYDAGMIQRVQVGGQPMRTKAASGKKGQPK